jgi:Cu/Ag efflux pump CusA
MIEDFNKLHYKTKAFVITALFVMFFVVFIACSAFAPAVAGFLLLSIAVCGAVWALYKLLCTIFEPW